METTMEGKIQMKNQFYTLTLNELFTDLPGAITSKRIATRVRGPIRVLAASPDKDAQEISN